MTDVELLLKKSNIPVFKLGGKPRAALPYMVYHFDSNYSGADNLVCIVTRDVTAEVYSATDIDTALEKTLIGAGVAFSKDGEYSDNDRMFITTYDFTLREKMEVIL